MTLNFTYKYYFFKIHVIMIITAKIKFYPHSGGRPLYQKIGPKTLKIGMGYP